MQFQTSAPSIPSFTMPMFFPQPTQIQNPMPPTLAQPPGTQVNNFMAGPPTIYFKERKAKLNWQKLKSIDLERLHEPSNIHLLEACLGNITYAGLDQEDCEKFSDPTLLKMFRLSQYSLEYLMNYQNYLYTQSQNLDMVYKQTEESLKPLEKKAQENQMEIQRLRQELKNKKKHIQAYQNTLNTPLFKCSTCKKYFKSQGYLDEHIQRRHSIPFNNGARSNGRSNKILLRDSATSPLVKTSNGSVYRYQENEGGNINEYSSSGSMRDRGVLTEKNSYEGNKSASVQDIAVFETMKDFIQKMRREDGEKISQIDELLKGKFDEILKNNNEIGKRVQELEHKVEIKRNNLMQSTSNLAEESIDENKENQRLLSNVTKDQQEVIRSSPMKDEGEIRKSAEHKPKMAGWVQYKEAREAKKQHTEGRKQLRLEDDLRITELANEETPTNESHKEVRPVEPKTISPQKDEDIHIHGRDFRQKEEDTDTIQIEDLEEEQQDVKPAKELKSHQLVEKVEDFKPKENANRHEGRDEAIREQVQAAVRRGRQEQNYPTQRFRAGNLEDDRALKPEKSSISVMKASDLEEDQNSDEEVYPSNRHQAIKLQKIHQSEGRNVHKKIEEVGEAHEGEPEFEDEDERERTMRIIESSMGIRGDEDKLMEKDRKAYLKAREAVNHKYQTQHVETREVEVAQEQVQNDLKGRFNQLFGENYDALAGKDVFDLETILYNLKNLNEKQKDRFSRMKQDYSKIQRRDVLLFDEKVPIKASEAEEDRVPELPEKSILEQESELQVANGNIRKAKESIAELEQVIKDSQESQEIRRNTPQSINIY